MKGSYRKKNKLTQELSLVFHQNCQLVAATSVACKAALNRSSLFVGNDSGPGHVAAAMGKPTLSLFGPTEPFIYAPQGRAPRKILQNKPLSDLTVETVANEILPLLSESATVSASSSLKCLSR